MNGLLLVDKPAGITSFEVVRQVRRWCATRQVGHCGTLDPSATGVLPVAVGTATRLVEYLQAGAKEYLATLRLGVVTDTQDADGQVVATGDWQALDQVRLEAALDGFRGEIHQVPPMHSALKRDGVPLYKLARRGIEVERPARPVCIDLLDITAFDLPLVSLRVACSKGTYIRTLCHDLGQRLGCGAHMTNLRRTRCGTFRLADCATLAELAALVEAGRPLPLLPLAEVLSDWPAGQVQAAAAQRLAHGVAPRLADVSMSGALAVGQPVRLLADGQLLALACYQPVRADQRPGDFLLWKVFPAAAAAA